MYLINWSQANQAITASDNGLSPVRHQAIIWTNAGLLLIRPPPPPGNKCQSNNFIQQNEFEQVICKILAILSPPQWVPQPHISFYICRCCVACNDIMLYCTMWYHVASVYSHWDDFSAKIWATFQENSGFTSTTKQIVEYWNEKFKL